MVPKYPYQTRVTYDTKPNDPTAVQRWISNHETLVGAMVAFDTARKQPKVKTIEVACILEQWNRSTPKDQ